MQYRIGKWVAELTDSRLNTAIAALAVGAVAALIEYVTHTAHTFAHVSEGTWAFADACVIGVAVTLLVWFLFAATRIRRRYILEHVRRVAELNHEVRNALQVIVDAQYVSRTPQTDAVMDSVQRIDHTLRELFPIIGERLADRRRVPPQKQRPHLVHPRRAGDVTR